MCTLQRGSHFCQMRPLSKIWNLKMRDVMKMLTTLPQSRYYGKSISDISRHISKGDARRFLSILTILNDKEKSNLSDVDEKSINDELSQLIKSIESQTAHQVNLPTLSTILSHQLAGCKPRTESA